LEKPTKDSGHSAAPYHAISTALRRTGVFHLLARVSFLAAERKAQAPQKVTPTPKLCCYGTMAAKHTLHVALTEPLVSYVDQKVSAGHYATASEVVRAGLRLLIEQEDEKESGRLTRPKTIGGARPSDPPLGGTIDR
jgi:antitoxin ParD1/3/4